MATKRALMALAVVGLAGAATWSIAQSPAEKTPLGGAKSRLTSSGDMPRLDSPGRLRSASPSSEPSLGSSHSTDTQIRIDHALVISLDPIKLPARDAGAIRSITVRKGQAVKVDDILGQLDDRDSQTKKKIAELERDAAKVQADSDAQIKAAKDGAKVTEENYKANEKMQKDRPGSLSDFDFRRSWFEWQRALAQIAVAEVEKSVAYATQLAKEGQIEGALIEIERRKIVAPIDGIVTEIYKHKGEWCQPGDPVVEIVRMDRLEIEGFVYAADTSPQKVLGKPVEVVVLLAGTETFKATGTITFASPVLEGSGRIRQFRVSTEIDNKKVTDERGNSYWLIQPGTEAEMTIDLTPAPARPALSPRTVGPAASKGGASGAKKVEANKPAIPEVVAPGGPQSEKTKATEQKADPAKSSEKPVADKAEPPKPEGKSGAKGAPDKEPTAPPKDDHKAKGPAAEKSDKPADNGEKKPTKPSKIVL